MLLVSAAVVGGRVASALDVLQLTVRPELFARSRSASIGSSADLAPMLISSLRKGVEVILRGFCESRNGNEIDNNANFNSTIFNQCARCKTITFMADNYVCVMDFDSWLFCLINNKSNKKFLLLVESTTKNTC